MNIGEEVRLIRGVWVDGSGPRGGDQLGGGYVRVSMRGDL